MRSLWLKKTMIVAVAALGAVGATTVPASAHYTTRHCDRDGDDCYTVRCDDDGDDCRRVSSYPRNYYDRRGYYGGYTNGYGSGNGFSLYFGNGWSNGYNRYNHYNDDGYRRHEHEDDEDE